MSWAPAVRLDYDEPKTWTKEALEESYSYIKSQLPTQHANYRLFLATSRPSEISRWRQIAEELQLSLDLETGRIRYNEGFKPLEINAEICYVRHGKTEGNTEPRVYQGMVDYPENQLTPLGVEQAAAAAERLQQLTETWGRPDLIVSSPLQRALQTAEPFRQKHKDIPFEVVKEMAEMRFGSWDNLKVADLSAESIGHLFYLDQNVIVKSGENHKIDADRWVHPEWLDGETEIPAENFLECLRRQRDALLEVAAMASQTVKGRKPRVVIFGHSMAGAAASVLLGFGRTDSSGCLGFDGSFIMPNATPTLLIPGSPYKEKQ